METTSSSRKKTRMEWRKGRTSIDSDEQESCLVTCVMRDNTRDWARRARAKFRITVKMASSLSDSVLTYELPWYVLYLEHDMNLIARKGREI